MHTRYQHFTVNEFLADEYFQQWVRFPDDENQAFWDQFLEQFPFQAEAVLEARSFLENLHISGFHPTTTQVERSLASTLDKINRLEKAKKVKVPVTYRNRFMLAAVIFAAVASIFLFLPDRDVPVTVSTKTGEIKKLVLPDQSIVTLNGGSTLRYEAEMMERNQREVWLEGEAFFEVKHTYKTKNGKSLFIVHSGDMNIEVLGTRFNVRKERQVTRVSLNEGSIRIMVADRVKTPIFLKPGDMISYAEGESILHRKVVKPELYSVWKEKSLQMDEMPLSDIISFLEENYRYYVKVTDPALLDAKISGKLQLQNEDRMLETLAFALNINIIKKDRILFFQPKN